jgi:trigger factor
MQAGETRSFEVDYPADYNAVSLRGALVDYTLVLKEIKRKVVPPIDDDLAKEFGTFSSLEELRTRVREEVARRAAETERAEARQRILMDLVRRHQVEVPDAMIEAQLDGRLEGLAREMIARGIDPTKAGVDWAEERTRARPAAVDAVRAMLILDAIAANERLEATDEDVNEWLKEEARRQKSNVAAVKEKLVQSSRLTGVRRQLVREKSLDYLLQGANITREPR